MSGIGITKKPRLQKLNSSLFRFSLPRKNIPRSLQRLTLVAIYVVAVVGFPLFNPQHAEAAIAFRSAATNTSDAGPNVNVNKPTNTASGDVMIASIRGGLSSGAATTAPAGWVLIDTATVTSRFITTFYKVAGGSEPGSYAFVINASHTGGGAIMSFSGVNNAAPIDNAGASESSNTGTGTTTSTTAFNTVKANTMIVAAFFCGAGTAMATASGMTEQYDITAGDGGAFQMSGDTALQAATGSTGSKTATCTSGTTWATYMTALAPEPSPTQSAYRFAVNADNNNPSFIVDNLTSADDTIRGVDNDTFSSVFYTVGDNGANWVIEKRRITDGSLCTSSNCTTTFGTAGRLTEDVASSTTEKAYAVQVDPSGGYIYVVGMDNVTGGGQWRIEKRTTSDGALVSGFGTGGIVNNNPSSGTDEALTILLDTTNGYIYVGGYDNTGNNQWSLQKYRTDNGNICTAANCGTQFGTNGIYIYNPTNSDDRISALEIDPTNTYLYVSGYSTAANGRTQWIAQKMLASTAGLCTAGNCGTQFATAGTYTSDPTTRDDKILDMQVDSASGAIYLAGFEENSASTMQWRIEKITLDAGTLVSAFGGSGCLTNIAGALCTSFSSGLDKIFDMKLDGAGGFLYVLGVMDEAGSNSQWRMQKRNRSDGSLVSSWATSGTASINPSSGKDPPARILIDLDRGLLWGLGGDRTLGTTNMQWYFTQLQLDTGTTWLAAQDTAAGASTNITFRLRLLLHITGQQLTAGTNAYKLQFAPKVGTCDTAFVGENYVDTGTASGEIQYHNNPSVTDATQAVAVSGDPAHSSDTTVLESIEESNNFSPIVTAAVNNDALWDFTLKDSSAFGAYCLRVVESDGTVLDGYNVVPEISFCKDDPKTDNILRHGTYFCEGLKKSFFWTD